MASHGERRAAEMEESAATLRELGLDPLMVEATVERQREMGAIGKDATVRAALTARPRRHARAPSARPRSACALSSERAFMLPAPSARKILVSVGLVAYYYVRSIQLGGTQ